MVAAIRLLLSGLPKRIVLIRNWAVIEIDAIYSPVVRVRYKTEDTRVGQRTNYDKLILEIWTDGTVTPEMAMVEAAKILRKYINPFVQYAQLGEETVEEEVQSEEAESSRCR